MNKFRHSGRSFGSRPGISMLIAIGLVSVIVFFGLIVSNVVISSIRQAANLNHANYAYYAAEGGLEVGLLENAEQAAGYTSNDTDVDYGGDVAASYKIQGQVPEDRKYQGGSYDGKYGIPTPGTGTAGADCDPLKAIYDSYFVYSSTKEPHYILQTGPAPQDYIGPFDPTLAPCNWNKLEIGSSVTIPLYVTTTDSGLGCPETAPSSGVYICNPDKLGLSELIIRMRTPCEGDPEMCLSGGRPDLDAVNPTSNSYCGDDPIVSWSISGVDKTSGDSLVMQPLISVDFDGQSCAWWQPLYSTSSIFEGKINSYKTSNGYEMIPALQKSYDQNGTKDSIFKFLLNSAPWNTQELHKPVLKLNIIHGLDDSNQTDTVPYLEYQVLTNNSIVPPTDTSQTVTVEGFSGEFKQILEVKVPQSGGVLEYVIQQ